LLATIQLLGRYTMRKLLDNDPWPPEEDKLPPPHVPKWFRKIRHWWRKRQGKEMEHPKKVSPKLKNTNNN